ncbi:MAG: DUF2079 domain-containing protein [Candidatus Kerfeldbacteria bacterium]|nr:DUF2079 domain-containing protein [Candidatus Kerfeldbacteria bacterium]
MLLNVPKRVWRLVIVFFVFSIVACWFQYHFFFYNQYDLGIYNQVFWNSVHGRWFQYSFNPYSYLVDHREWGVLLLLPVYALVQHPMTLLVLQTAVIATGAIPTYLLARQIAQGLSVRGRDRLALVSVVVYLLHPLTHAVVLFEFHALSFVLPLTLWWWLCMISGQRLRTIVIFILLLLVRDDVAVMTSGVGLLLLVFGQGMQNNKRWRWIGFGIMAVSVLWFIIMARFGAALAPKQALKFGAFYSWMGNGPWEYGRFMFSHPIQTLHGAFGEDHVLVLVLLFSSCAFLPLLRPRYLLPLAGPAVEYLLIDRSLFDAFFHAHYSAIIFPWLMIASLYGVTKLFTWLDTKADYIYLYSMCRMGLLAIILVQVTLFGPWYRFGVLFMHRHDRDRATMVSVLQDIAPDDAVMVSPVLYPQLSNRERIYPTIHLLHGTQHYSNEPYIPPAYIDWLVVDQQELSRFPGAQQRLAQLITAQDLILEQATPELLVYHRPFGSAPRLVHGAEPGK